MYDQKISPKTRVLVVRNSKTSMSILKSYEYKEIININTNFVFVLFYDLRVAIEAQKDLSKNYIDAYFCLNSSEIEKACQSTIYFIMKDMKSPLSEDEILNVMEKYGDIKEIRDYKPYKKYIEYYDTRDCNKALGLEPNAFNKGKVECKLAWDNNPKKREELEQIVNKVINETEEIKGNIFMDALDEFIATKIKQIEKMVKEKYNQN